MEDFNVFSGLFNDFGGNRGLRSSLGLRFLPIGDFHLSTVPRDQFWAWQTGPSHTAQPLVESEMHPMWGI